jgi:hypothetical protein
MITADLMMDQQQEEEGQIDTTGAGQSTMAGTITNETNLDDTVTDTIAPSA